MSMARFLRMSSGKLFCLICLREMSERQARFHVLRCKARVMTGQVVGGKRKQVEAQ